MKKVILLIFLLAVGLVNAQEKEKFRVGLDFGFAKSSGSGVGGLFAIEPKFNINDNMNVGLRIEGVGLVKNIEGFDSDSDNIDAEVGLGVSYVGVFDYYFHKGESSFAPFVGGGLGYYSLANVKLDDSDVENGGDVHIKGKGKFGGMIRGGFEWHKLRVTAQYNFIPTTDLQNIDGDVVGKTKNNYFGIGLGFYIGGGKWSK